jgi:hypothetical protein
MSLDMPTSKTLFQDTSTLEPTGTAFDLGLGAGLGIPLLLAIAVALVGALFLAFQYYSFRRKLKLHVQKWQATCESRKAILHATHRRLLASWEEQYGAFQDFLSKLSIKSKAGFNETSGSNKNLSKEPFSDNLALTLDVAYFTAGIVSTQSVLSGHFRDATERHLHTEFDSVGSFVETLQERLAPGLWERLFGADLESETISGWANSIKGHLGEADLKEMLEAEGLSVEVPETGSQPGFDLLVEGKEFQVKTVSNYSSVREHLAEHPGIPALFNADAQSIPEHVPTMSVEELSELVKAGDFEFPAVAIEGLSEEAINAATEEGLDAAIGGVDLGIPVATVAMSSLRELKTWREGHTDGATALTNVGVDTGARTLGITTGAAIGSFLLPGVGTVVGGAIGAFLGGRGAKAFRERDANASQEELQRTHEEAQAHLAKAFEGPKKVFSNIENSFWGDWKAISAGAQQELARYHAQVKSDAEKTAQQFQNSIKKAKEAFSKDLQKSNRLLWAIAPEKYAALRAKEKFLETQNDELAVLLLDDSPFSSSVVALEEQKEKALAANHSLSRAIEESQRRASLAAKKQAERLVTEFEPAQQKSLHRAIEALESLLPLVVAPTTEARKASLRSRAEVLVRFESSLKDEIQKLKLQQEKSSAQAERNRKHG